MYFSVENEKFRYFRETQLFKLNVVEKKWKRCTCIKALITRPFNHWGHTWRPFSLHYTCMLSGRMNLSTFLFLCSIYISPERFIYLNVGKRYVFQFDGLEKLWINIKMSFLLRYNPFCCVFLKPCGNSEVEIAKFLYCTLKSGKNWQFSFATVERKRYECCECWRISNVSFHIS